MYRFGMTLFWKEIRSWFEENFIQSNWVVKFGEVLEKWSEACRAVPVEKAVLEFLPILALLVLTFVRTVFRT